jgi:hypothetical protein
MVISQVSTLSASLVLSSPPLHFPIFPFPLTDIHYTCTLCLYITFGSAKYWLIYPLSERKGIRRNAVSLMLMLLALVLLIIFVLNRFDENIIYEIYLFLYFGFGLLLMWNISSI